MGGFFYCGGVIMGDEVECVECFFGIFEFLGEDW